MIYKQKVLQKTVTMANKYIIIYLIVVIYFQSPSLFSKISQAPHHSFGHGRFV